MGWVAIFILTVTAGYKADSWTEFGDSYTKGSWLRVTVEVVQGLCALDIIFALIGWTKNGVLGPFLQISGKLFTVFLIFPVTPKASEGDTWLGRQALI